MANKRYPRLQRPLLCQADACAYTGLSLRWFRRRIEERNLGIPIVKVGNRNFYAPDDLDRLVAELPHVRYDQGNWVSQR